MMMYVKYPWATDLYRLVDNEHYYSLFRKDGTEVATFGMGASLGTIMDEVEHDYKEYKVELDGIARLQGIIKFEEGYGVSQATLRIQDLLASCYQLLARFGLNKDLRNNITPFFDADPSPYMRPMFYQPVNFIGDESEACELYNGEIYEYFSNVLAPEGYYFGSTEGDGADIGFWRSSIVDDVYQEEGEDD